MSDLFATILTQHAERRAAAGVTGAATRANIRERAVSRSGERAAALMAERDARRSALDWEEDSRLKVRAGAILSAIKRAAADGEGERVERLSALVELVKERRAAVTGAYWNDEHVGHTELRTGGTFYRYAAAHYARVGQNLGMLSMDADDIVGEAVELCYRWLKEDGADMADVHAAAQGPMIAGGIDTGIPLGLMYRAIKTVYRRGLGEFGNMARGKLTERDEHGHSHAVESETVTYARERQMELAAQHAAARTVIRAGEDDHTVDPDALAVAEGRTRALATLTNRFPLNADGRMLAVAALLAEGYTVEEIADRAGITPTTINRWGGELASLHTDNVFKPVIGGRDAALDARLAAHDARIAARDLSVHVTRIAS